MVFSVGFAYQSHDISFGDWVTLLTLCLAPLIAHIAAGVPPATYLHSKRPRWHDRMCLYNPTSILWRYLAIVDRRSRAKSWTSLDMAASNALFWDGCKWDGSEDMIQRARDFCVRAPKHHHVDLLSGSTIVTLIVTLQGIQAVYSIIYGSAVTQAYSASVSISTIFYPLASLSLLRLPAAFWLTNDYIYRHNEEWEVRDSHEFELGPNIGKQSESAPALVSQSTMTSMESAVIPGRFHNHRSWLSVIVRSVYLIMVMGLLALALFEIIGRYGPVKAGPWTATNFTLNLTFLVFLVVTTGILLAYIILNRFSTTVIPCISTGWYKAYTSLLFAAMFVVFVVAALETRKSPCGVYTTFTETSGVDMVTCGRSLYVGMANQTMFGAVTIGTQQNGSTIVQEIPYTNVYGMALSADNGDIVVLAFNGWCMIDHPLTAANVSMFQPVNSTTLLLDR